MKSACVGVLSIISNIFLLICIIFYFLSKNKKVCYIEIVKCHFWYASKKVWKPLH